MPVSSDIYSHLEKRPRVGGQSVFVQSPEEEDISKDADILKAKELLSRISSVKSSLNEKKIDQEAPSKSLSNFIVDEEEVVLVKDLQPPDAKPQYSLKKRVDNNDITLNDINELIGIIPSQSNPVTKLLQDPSVKENKVKIKTRLNGKHEWKWKVSSADKFGKVSE